MNAGVSVSGDGQAAGLQVRRIADGRALDALGPTWARLHDGCPSPYVLLDHRWVSSWWRAFGSGKELHVLAVEQAGRAIGIVPMVLSSGLEVWPMRDGGLQIAEDHRNLRLPSWRRVVPVRRVSFPLNVPSHNARAHAIAPAERSEAVCSAAMDYWSARRGDWDAMALEGLPCASGQRGAFRRAAARCGLPSPPHGARRCIFMADISGGFEAYLANRSAHFRKRMRQAIRACEKIGRIEIRVYRGSDTASGLDVMFDIERRTWKANVDPNAPVNMAIDDRIRGFFTDVGLAFSATDEAAIYVLELDGRAVSALMTLATGRTILTLVVYIADEVRGSLNTAPLWAAMFEDTVPRGITTVDIHGVTEHARKWATYSEEFQRLYIFNSRPTGQLLFASKSIATSLSRLLAAWRDDMGDKEHGWTQRDSSD